MVVFDDSKYEGGGGGDTILNTHLLVTDSAAIYSLHRYRVAIDWNLDWAWPGTRAIIEEEEKRTKTLLRGLCDLTISDASYLELKMTYNSYITNILSICRAEGRGNGEILL